MSRPLPPPATAAAMALGLVTALGLFLRVIHLDLPMRYDETVTWMSYASRGWDYLTSHYPNPNNHVFHSLLVATAAELGGDDPWVLRLPAFLAGVLLVPVTGWLGYRIHGRTTAVAAALLVATHPVLVLYSVNARGYTLMALCVVLAVIAADAIVAGPRGSRLRRWVAWAGLVEVGILGFYTVPTMLLPWAGLTLWLLVDGLVTSPGDPDHVASSPFPRWGAVVVANLVLGLVVVGLYSGILRNEGLDALTRNRFVAPAEPGAFLQTLPSELVALLRHWAQGFPPVMATAAGAAVVLGLLRSGAVPRWRLLLLCLTIGSLGVTAVTRNLGEPRIWLWVLPLLAVAGGMAVEGARHAGTRITAGALVVTGAVWIVASSIVFVGDTPVRDFRETGGLPEARAVLDLLEERVRPGDRLVSDFVTGEPLRYYLNRWAEGEAGGSEDSGESAGRDVDPVQKDGDAAESARGAVDPVRMWIVLNEHDSLRARRLRQRLEQLGTPPPEELSPVLEVGAVRVFLVGRAPEAGSAPPAPENTGVRRPASRSRGR